MAVIERMLLQVGVPSYDHFQLCNFIGGKTRIKCFAATVHAPWN